MKIELSVVIITFNEEKNIARCLLSVKDIADDIVVVDSFSTDKTKEICLQHGARFIEHAFNGHIEQKNWAITQAQFPFILSLDADEALDDTLKQEIASIKNHWEFDGYKMNRLTNYCGQWIKHCGWYPDTKLRLWDSRKGRWQGINPHDRYELNENANIKHLKGNILHYSYYTIEEHYKQLEYFSSISAKAMHGLQKNSSLLHLLFKPLAKFIKAYLIKRGFLDGKNGFIISKLMAYETFLKYKKLLHIQKSSSSSAG
ncbi:MAG: glycosyltransferase family 2 protein [Flavobacteriales bacterium]|nr:glycosyltransferase family 2 protein [Flavobacteriales bacterium]